MNPLYLLISFVISCPEVDCESLSVGICAERTENDIEVNENGCTSDTTCLVTEFDNWYENEGTTLFCRYYEEDDEDEPDDYECTTKPSNEYLQEGLHPKRCNNSSDCRIENGSETECSCGMDGFSYCQPAWGSEVFDDLWEYCEEEDDEIDYDFYEYYEELHTHYANFIMAPDCARSIFEELEDLVEKPEWALLSGLVFYFLI